MKKRCGHCGETKDISKFYKDKNRSDGHQSNCCKCMQARSKKFYEDHPDYRSNVATSHANLVKRLREIAFNHLVSHPCLDCGESDIVFLDFDHIKDKKFNISRAIQHGCPIDRFIKEMEKCEIRCVKCHRLKTFKEQGSWRLEYIERYKQENTHDVHKKEAISYYERPC